MPLEHQVAIAIILATPVLVVGGFVLMVATAYAISRDE